jgi:hypothetical protein
MISKIALQFHIASRTRSYLFKASRLSGHACIHSYYDMTSNVNKLLSDVLDDPRESKRMKFSSDALGPAHPPESPWNAPIDASPAVSSPIMVNQSPSDGRNTGTCGAAKKVAKSMKREDHARSGKGKKKDRQNPERRNRRGTRNEPAVEEGDKGDPKAPRLPKRQCALLIGFCGSGYSGMQMYASCNYYRLFLIPILQSTGSYSNDRGRAIPSYGSGGCHFAGQCR